jgi:hypothetical protein
MRRMRDMARARHWLTLSAVLAVVAGGVIPAIGAAGLTVSAPVAVAPPVTGMSCAGAVCPRTQVIRLANSTPATGDGFRELQMNLCDGGDAPCYPALNNGQSTTEGARLIHDLRPSLVTVNEVCARDVLAGTSPLHRAMADLAGLSHDAVYFVSFMPAGDHRSGKADRCVNGDDYGIGLLGRGPDTGYAFGGGIHPYQDEPATTMEERAWLCVSAQGGYDACTTHLTNRNPAVARQQCGYLLDTAIPRFRDRFGEDPVVLGGDFNLRLGGVPNVQDCVPPGWFRKGDGDLQHVLATGEFGFVSDRVVPMRHTDHPAFVVDLSRPVRVGPITVPGGCAEVSEAGVVRTSPCDGTNAQKWIVRGNGTLESRTGECLDVFRGGTADGTPVRTWQCDGTGAQRWYPADGQLINSESGRCLTEPGQSGGIQLVISDCDRSTTQRWTLPNPGK